MRHFDSRRAILLAAAVMGMAGGVGTAAGANGTWSPTAADSEWLSSSNWTDGIMPGVPGAGANTDSVTFGASAVTVVEPDAGRAVGQVNFNANVPYTLGATTSSNSLSLTHLYTNGTTGTITVNSPLIYRLDGRAGANPGQTLELNGAVTIDAGRTLLLDRNGTIEFNGTVGSNAASGNYASVRYLGGTATRVAHFNAANFRLNLQLDTGGEGSAHLNAAGAAPGGVNIGTGKVYVSAENALSGPANLAVGVYGNYSAGKSAYMEINQAQSYLGNTFVGQPNLADRQGEATLLVNNLDGSATGSGHVRVVSGVLGGNGFIVNSDASPTQAARGVTVEKRVRTSDGEVTYGKLSPGAAAGVVGVLTFDLGSVGLDISGAVADAATGSLLFDLHTPAASDQVVLLSDTALSIGNEGLALDDFAFSLPAGPGSLQAGTYTLFQSTVPIAGSLAPAGLSGVIDGKSATLGLGNGGTDIILDIAAVPEPSAMVLLGTAALALLRRRPTHRMTQEAESDPRAAASWRGTRGIEE